jgi:hypothetical protein
MKKTDRPSIESLPTAAAPDRNAPRWIRLTEAGEPYGLSAAALRAEARKGHLVIYRLRGKDWTTVADVQEMFERSRVPRTDPVSGSIRRGTTESQSGPPEMPDVKLALAAARAIILRRKQSSPPTLPKRIGRIAK